MRSRCFIMGSSLIGLCLGLVAATGLSREWSVPQVAESDSFDRILEILKQTVSAKFTEKDRRGPLIDVLRRIASTHELRLVIDESLLQRESKQFAAPVRVPVANTSLYNVFRFLIDSPGWHIVPRLDGLYLTDTIEEYDQEQLNQLRVYDVNDLVTSNNNRRTEQAEVDQPDARELAETSNALNELELVIPGIVAPSQWADVGGSGVIKRLEVANAKPQFLIRTSRRNHSEISQLLALLRQAKQAQSPTQDAADAASGATKRVPTSLGGTAAHPIRKSLDEVREFPGFENAPLEDALSQLGNICGIPWAYVPAKPRFAIVAEAPSSQPVNSPPGKYSGQALLKHWLRSQRITTEIKYDLLLVTNHERAEETEPTLEVRVYPVRDLVTFQLTNGKTVRDFDTLINTITATVATSSWGNVGGPGSVWPNDILGSLVIVQTAEAHQQIGALLETARQTVPVKTGDVTAKVSQPVIPEGLQLRIFTMDSPQAAQDLAATIPHITTAERWSAKGGKGTLHVVGSAVVVRQEHDMMKEVIQLMRQMIGYEEPQGPPVDLLPRWGGTLSGHGVGGGGGFF